MGVDRLVSMVMKLQRVLICGIAGIVLAGARLFAADSNPTNAMAATAAVYVPDTSHQNDPLPDDVLAWSSLTQETTVAADAGNALFAFSFTNIATVHETALVTNITTITNITAVTNSFFFWFKKNSFVTNFSTATSITTNTVTRPVPVAILEVHPSCGCTTAQLPPLPWIIPPGTNGQFGLTVNLAGKSGMQVKTVNVKTDKGSKQLILKINILPPVAPSQSDADRARALEMAKADRQAVFHGDCAACHVKPGEGKYGKPLYFAICANCHESKTRASMVPDLHNLKTPTNVDFWQTWIAHGKAGSLMPAFSTADGGPLSDMQITSLAGYLNATIPSQTPANK
jgi:mono/diheme cytochrome c family protein